MADLEQIGLALQGFSAGASGQLPQFNQFLAQRQKQQESLSKERRTAMANDAFGALNFVKQGRPDLASQLISNRIQAGSQIAGADLSQSQTLLDALQSQSAQTPEGLAAIQRELQDDVSIFTAEGLLATQEKPAEQRAFEAKLSGLDEEQKKEATLISLGLSPRAVGSAIQTIADQDIAELIGDAEATIGQRKKFGEMTGASRSKTIDKGFERIAGITKNITNIDRAISALDAGAGTGPAERFFPTIKAATTELNQIRGELALDVVGAVTFGALSKGELDLASDTALPIGLNEPELRDFLVRKKAAQQKLRDYYGEQIQFLDQGGTIAGFLRQKSRDAEQGAAQSGQQSDVTTLSDEDLFNF